MNIIHNLLVWTGHLADSDKQTKSLLQVKDKNATSNAFSLNSLKPMPILAYGNKLLRVVNLCKNKLISVRSIQIAISCKNKLISVRSTQIAFSCKNKMISVRMAHIVNLCINKLISVRSTQSPHLLNSQLASTIIQVIFCRKSLVKAKD